MPNFIKKNKQKLAYFEFSCIKTFKIGLKWAEMLIGWSQISFSCTVENLGLLDRKTIDLMHFSADLEIKTFI